MLEKDLQGFPGTAAQIGKKLSIIQEVTAENFRDAEDKMPVRDLLEDIHTKPFLDAVLEINKEKFMFEVGSGIKPSVIKQTEGDDYLCIVMPLKI